MSGPEARAWGSVQRHLKSLREALHRTSPAQSEDLHWQRLESGSTASGIFDLTVCFRSVETWVELKSVPLPKRVPYILNPMSDQQREWGRARVAAGGRAVCLVQLRSAFSAVWCAWPPGWFAVEQWPYHMLKLNACLLLSSSEATSERSGRFTLS